MKIQMDSKKRVVALSNLEAMCKRISGTCHRFSVSKVNAHRCYVEYSNPNEYGTENPMTAVFPCWAGHGQSMFACDDDCYVVLDILDVRNDSWDGEGWQAFQELIDCPELYRQSVDSNEWRTTEEWLGAKKTTV